MKIFSHENVVKKGWFPMDAVANVLVANNFLTKFAEEIAGYMKLMEEIHIWVNSCGTMVATLVARVSL